MEYKNSKFHVWNIIPKCFKGAMQRITIVFVKINLGNSLKIDRYRKWFNGKIRSSEKKKRKMHNIAATFIFWYVIFLQQQANCIYIIHYIICKWVKMYMYGFCPQSFIHRSITMILYGLSTNTNHNNQRSQFEAEHFW
jgi:hypothetical protein